MLSIKREGGIVACPFAQLEPSGHQEIGELLLDDESSVKLVGASEDIVYIRMRLDGGRSKGNCSPSSCASCKRVRMARYGADAVPYVTVVRRKSCTSIAGSHRHRIR